MKVNGMVERRVTCTLEHEEQFYVAENVPARVDEDTGDQYFGPYCRTAAGGDPQ